MSDTAGNVAIGRVNVSINTSGGGNPGNYDVVFNPGDNISGIVSSKPAGTKFYFNPGKYRLHEIHPKDNQVFVGANGAILSGARKLTNWSQEGGLWVVGGQTQGTSNIPQNDHWGYCLASKYNGCVFPQEVFIDGQRQQHVRSKSAVGPGKWYFDYGADKIYIGTNPSGKQVETSVTEYAFESRAKNVRIENLTIEMYANGGRTGAINGREGRNGAAGTGWIVKNNTVRNNHGRAIKTHNSMQVIGNHTHHNGAMGIGTAGNNVLIADNEVNHNCEARFKCIGFEAAGIKMTNSNNVTIRNNHVHHNYGHAVHGDIHMTNTIYENNVVTDNEGIGISHEISGNAKIRWNIVERNGFSPPESQYDFEGILVLSSSDTEVYGNTLRDNARGLLARQDNRTSPYKLVNLWVHDNYIEMQDGERTGLSVTINDNSYFDSKNNRFDYNTYVFKYSGAWAPFRWKGGVKHSWDWIAAGNDVNGTVPTW